ncbi:helicase-like transcription factor CHR28 [Lactuca sativa]|uniref:helicase-like transcription factor CHR28 n=1 Tax=Lactuca sativa TaxID=4236 RepID=UPI000CD8C157|nr:helicase-like transcription factor CHR28 [Lactuca sativa]
MMMTNGGTPFEWHDDDDTELGADDGALSMDIESFLSILDEDRPDDSSQSGLVDPSLSIALCNESASNVGANEQSQIHDDHSEASASRTVCSSGSSDCERQTVNYGLTKVEPLPAVSSMHFLPADWGMPVPPSDFSSSRHYDNRETNFERATEGGSFGISDDDGNHQLMDNSGITDFANLSTTPEVPFIDVSGYSDLLCSPDGESSRLYRNDPSVIYNNGMFFSDKIASNEYQNSGIEQYASAKSGIACLPSSESSSDTPAKVSTNGNHFSGKMLNRRQIVSIMERTNNGPFSMNNRSATSHDFSLPTLPRVVPFLRKDHVMQTPSQSFIHHDTSIKKESKFAAFSSMGSMPPKMGHVTYIDVDDPDICILEDMSEPAPRKPSPVDLRPPIHRSSIGVPPTHMGYNNARIKANDEQVIYRVALQDLSQPKSEASAPDGSLVVSLLRHQRIALSWMVQKETKSMHCFGGILADDQGLGKTISTIALILKERSPSSSVRTTEVKKIETETLNLDDDDEDDDVTELDKSKKKNNLEIKGSETPIDLKNTSSLTKSRPAAGTLVVCPTSVLRQWNDELHNKVTSQANLSVLVYHGANRTKDPSELAKYDVVLTTYAIVSMEVPKQPLVDEEEDETKRRSDYPPVGLSPSKKRKYPPSSKKGSKKDKKGSMDNELFESLARPLAKVRWFRVVLDEAQSIKNHRTQVARACWGLRAKRRWCLSGTPIQNAIDDLYSYFRFLRYDPYAVYKSFCSQIKGPIQRSPGTGYRKLQAVLKTIMLRRTKATLLDGEPIISLPPKTINLKKVEFTAEERDFYCRLESESRAQFAEYAAAGTVKQNYVNILLMLLRLRQACDHPLLVRGCSSNSEWKSSLDKAKKLPPEKRVRLLNCLEASLAICSICSDPPEDAVVTTCEHVFCNQCILEHLSSDDSQCPSPKCKVILNTSSVFSKSTLRISLGDHNTLDSSTSVKPEPLEQCSSSGSVSSSNIEAAEALDSSKIKAAVDVLTNIAKPKEIQCSNDLDLNVKETVVVREKAIVFSQWTRMLDLLEACLKDSSIGYRRLDGTMSVLARDKAVKDFNTLPEVSVMIMSLKAASLGLNMVAACHVLLLDLWWNPTTEDQAIDRAHRIGQTRPVSVLRLTVKDTVEDRILALQQKKREMVSSAFGEDETGSSQTRLTVDDLKYLFQA